MLTPLLFEPNLHPTVWGGKQIQKYKNLTLTDEPIGESWEVSVVPSSVSIISNGAFKGMPLDKVVKEYGAELLGKEVFEKYNGQFPLLIKFIDAAADLSIQVHPNDELASEVGKNGKTECWYIIDAKPGAYLYAGMKEKISKEEYVKRVEEGTICDVLAKHDVKTGDVFYLPAGRVHAICGGILLAEVQQNSDITYRIFDYNRPGLDGKPRQLHTAEALRAIDFNVQDEYRTIYNNDEQKANPCIESPFFTVRIVATNRPFHRNLMKYDSFIVTMCLEGDCKIQIRSTGDSVLLRAGHSCLIPACIADYDIIPQNDKGTTRLLDAYINNNKNLVNKVTRFLHIAD
jgi:mannose-6-phosphate isomerase